MTSGKGLAVSSTGTRAMLLTPKNPQDHCTGWASLKEKLLLRLGLVQQPNSSHLRIWCGPTPSVWAGMTAHWGSREVDL